MPEGRIRTELKNKGKSFQHRISHTSIIKLLVESAEPMRHILDTLLIGRKISFKRRHHPGWGCFACSCIFQFF